MYADTLSAATAHARIRDRSPDRLHVFRDGFLYASAGAATETCRYAASLLVAMSGDGIEIEVGGRTSRHSVVALRPCIVKRLRARGTPFLCLDAGPVHPMHRSFSAIRGSGLLDMPRDHFREVEAGLRDFHAGNLTRAEVQQLFRRTTHLATALLPEPRPLDSRLQRVLAMLDENPLCGREQLARAACLSHDRFSHLFSEEVGLSLRKYTQSLKILAASQFLGSGLSLTQIAAAAGFTDSAHFCKVWTRAYGASPAHFFNSRSVTVEPLQD
jgi:AraC-like DNA-binding protein